MRAYPEYYVNNARDHLAIAFTLAVDVYCIDGSLFAQAFTLSSIAKEYEAGSPRVLAGMSGTELFETIIEERMVLDAATIEHIDDPHYGPDSITFRTQAYWIGWAAALCQWELCCTFCELFRAVPYTDFESLYPTYHEMDYTHLVEYIAQLLLERKKEKTALARIREACGITQEELAQRAEVGLRSIQMYEQRNNDINKAQAISLYRIARTLGCSMEDLLENPWADHYEYFAARLP